MAQSAGLRALLQVVVGRTGDQMLTSEAGEVTRWVVGAHGGLAAQVPHRALA